MPPPRAEIGRPVECRRNGARRVNLLSLARAHGELDAHPTDTINVSQERLGSMLSLSRQTVNAQLQDLEQEQLVICVRGGVRILDFARLLDLAASTK
jgi:CRP/FNR family cyclic AMP-dependent transcriptional regulator